MQPIDVVRDDIKPHWNDNAGVGSTWEKPDVEGKNACSNGPAALFAARLFREKKNFDDLHWAKMIYKWERETLFDEETGAVWDNIRETEDGLKINKDWVFTYNQGTFIGAAVELFTLTGDSAYFKDAVLATDYTLEHLTVPEDNLLKSEGNHDGGLFKGIFIRYFTQLIKHHALDQERKERYTKFLFQNAHALWNNGTDKEEMLFSPYWNE